MASNIILASDISVDAITYGAPKSLDNGGKIISLFHKGKPLVFQTPALYAPYGMSRWANDDASVVKYNVDLSLGGPGAGLLDSLKQLDAKLIADGLANSATWFKKKYTSAEVVEALYTKVVKYAKDRETGEVTDKFPPTMKLAVPFRNGKCECEAYDVHRNQLPDVTESVPKRSNVTAIVQCTGLWIAGGKFGCTFKVLQMLVAPPAGGIKGFAFVEDEDDTTRVA